MNAIAISSFVFISLLGGAALGLILRKALPEHHLNSESKDAAKIAMALIATMTALVLGLLIASAKSSYDAQSTELTQMSAKIVLLDRVLAHYGPETKDIRESLRANVADNLNQIWSSANDGSSQLEPKSTGAEVVFDKIQLLSPKDDAQRALQALALNLAMNVGETRWLMYEQAGATISKPFLVIVVFWLVILFISFGLFAPLNLTVVSSFFVCAMSASAAIFLIVEMYRPYSGLIQISNVPLRAALAHLGQ
ncbi:MAG TPA: hypothetical protein VJX70_07470 [Candidatus Acidoferrum sp.]|nr:hypothetical protein [Candidatus Acidoferrum sp.]